MERDFNPEAKLPVVGLIPAGGRAERLSPLPCSKEVLPVDFVARSNGDGKRPRVVSEYLLAALERAGIERAFFVLAPGKWDIPAYFAGENSLALDLAYITRRSPLGVPFTIDAAYSFIRSARVAFGFPDIIFQPETAIAGLIARQEETGADVVLGVFPVERPERWDGVVFDEQGKIERIAPKPHRESTGRTWILALWMPAFTRIIHDFVRSYPGEATRSPEDSPGDVSLGQVVQIGMEQGLIVDHVKFEEGSCLDVGTPEDLQSVWRRLS